MGQHVLVGSVRVRQPDLERNRWNKIADFQEGSLELVHQNF